MALFSPALQVSMVFARQNDGRVRPDGVRPRTARFYRPQTDPGRQAAMTFAASAAWIVFAILLSRIVAALVPQSVSGLFYWLFLSGLFFAGFMLLARVSVPDLRPLSAVGFVRRPTAGREFALGTAIGWALAIALLLPALFTGNLSATISFSGGGIGIWLVSLLTLLFHAAALQLVLAGLPFRMLMRASGPGWAAAAVVVMAGLLTSFSHGGDGSSMLFAALAAALCCAGFLRTHAGWLSLGLYAAWTAILAFLFGQGSPYLPAVSSPVQGSILGTQWLTGAPFGPEASGLAPLFLLAALWLLVRTTRDYAWHYTFQPIEGAGYPMDVAPPAEHTRMEQAAAAQPPLVQIQSVPGPVPTPRTGASIAGEDAPGIRE